MKKKKLTAILLTGMLLAGSTSMTANAVILSTGNRQISGGQEETGGIVELEETDVPLAVLSEDGKTKTFPWGEITAGGLMLCIVAAGVRAVIKRPEKTQE